jgi:2-oxoisovalerate dehydrogenase E1 component alpha subunit
MARGIDVRRFSIVDPMRANTANFDQDMFEKVVRKASEDQQDLREKLARAEQLITDLQLQRVERVETIDTEEVEDEQYYPGTKRKQRFVPKPAFMDPEDFEEFPIFRLLDDAGNLVEGADENPALLDQELSIKMYSKICRVEAMDDIFFNAQRQGRLTFYVTNSGEEAMQIGSAAALKDSDTIFAQYREVGVLLWRGFSVESCADQCMSNSGDTGKGRQLPVHYGSAQHNFQTISSPLGTQIPQAVGAAYSMKTQEAGAPRDQVCICYFGEGAASEGDFHAGMNFAATMQVPLIFFCRNNGFAISTPSSDQFSDRCDGIAARGPAYGIRTIRVDGNDVYAVLRATQEARSYAVKNQAPVLIEAMTYRVSHHSTSDDSTTYRPVEEIAMWKDTRGAGMRIRNYMEAQGWWDTAQEEALRDAEKQHVMQALTNSEKKSYCGLETLFTDVYQQMPDHLQEQQEELEEHIAKYPGEYGTAE